MLKEILIGSGAIKFGDFVLTSGKRSSYYVDIKEAATNPEVLDQISGEFAQRVKASIIAGMELGAVPIMVATSMKLKIPYIIVRKERSHGTMNLIIGKFAPGTEIDVIEDVVTTGNSVLKTVLILRENGAVVRRAYCVVDREEGGKELLEKNEIDLFPLIRISDIKK